MEPPDNPLGDSWSHVEVFDPNQMSEGCRYTSFDDRQEHDNPLPSDAGLALGATFKIPGYYLYIQGYILAFIY